MILKNHQKIIQNKLELQVGNCEIIRREENSLLLFSFSFSFFEKFVFSQVFKTNSVAISKILQKIRDYLVEFFKSSFPRIIEIAIEPFINLENLLSQKIVRLTF